MATTWHSLEIYAENRRRTDLLSCLSATKDGSVVATLSQKLIFSWGSGSPSNSWFLGSVQAHNPNGITIGSAVFAGLIALFVLLLLCIRMLYHAKSASLVFSRVHVAWRLFGRFWFADNWWYKFICRGLQPVELLLLILVARNCASWST